MRLHNDGLIGSRTHALPKLPTLDDLERLIRTLAERMRTYFGAYCENLNEDRPKLSAAKM